MGPAARTLLRQDAARYIWWENPDEAMLRPARVVAQVMNIGDLDDAWDLLDALGANAFREVLGSAEPGWFNARSWYYWHFALGICQPGGTVPALPMRRFDPA